MVFQRIETQLSVREVAERPFRRFAELIAERAKQRLVGELDEIRESQARNAAYSIQIMAALQASDSRSILDLFGDSSDDYWLWANTTGTRYFPELESLLPSLPPEPNQRAVAGTLGDASLTDGFEIYKLFRDLIASHYGPVRDCDALLDFGCGWGRTLRFFLKDVEGDKLWGLDLLDEQISYARETNPYSHFLTTPRHPPSGLPDAKFDAVMAYSVLSHISEATHSRWMAEFGRILKPGGLAVLTTWGRDRSAFFESVASGRSKIWESHYNEGMAREFPGVESWLRQYDSGMYCHVDLGYQGNEDYGETSIPFAYAKREWNEQFEMVEFVSDRSRCQQDVFVVRRR